MKSFNVKFMFLFKSYIYLNNNYLTDLNANSFHYLWKDSESSLSANYVKIHNVFESYPYRTRRSECLTVQSWSAGFTRSFKEFYLIVVIA